MRKLLVYVLCLLSLLLLTSCEEILNEMISQGNVYTVTFYLDGGTIDGQDEYGPVKVKHENTVPEPPLPSREGYVFYGWKVSGGNVYWDFRNGLKRNMTLVAEWGKKTVTTDEQLVLWFDEDIDGYAVETYRGNTEKLVIPASFADDSGQTIDVKTIADNAFSNNSFSEIILPDTIESIGARAFSGCVNLHEIRIPSSVAVMGEKVFNGIIIDVYLPWPESEIPPEWSDEWKSGSVKITVREF